MNMQKAEPVRGSQFITITLPPKAYKFKAKEQFERTKPGIMDTFLTHTNDYCLIAELTEQGNVHYHGWFTERYDRSTLFLLDHLKQRHLGFVQINKARINDVERTYKYMCKDIDITKKLIKHPVLSNKLKILSKTL